MADSALVQANLFGFEKCSHCLAGFISKPENDRTEVMLALVESQGEYALFVYEGKVNDLLLSLVLQVHGEFSFSVVSQTSHEGVSELGIKFSSNQTSLVAEVPQGEILSGFLQQLKEAVKICEQNCALGLQANFEWIEKYGVPLVASISPPLTSDLASSRDAMEEQDNSFMDDFDPFRQAGQSPGSADQNWMKTLLTQPNVGNNCPVVQDTSNTILERTGSFSSLNGSESGSFQNKKFDLQEAALKRSYENSLDDLDASSSFPVSVQDPAVPAMESSRDNHIKLQMRERESDYTNLQPYRIFCGTWNVNGQQASEAINEWLCPAEDSEPPDIYAIGFQELDLSKNAYIFSESVREEDWYKRIKEALHPKAKYKKVKLVRLVGMMLVVFIRKGLELEIYDVMSGTVGTGIMGVMGNKGGVAVRFGLRDSTLCFVNSHLAAHTVEFERRNQDFKDINSRMLFGNRTISDHDIVIWLGDLNYRLSDIDNDACKKLISDGRLQELMKYDQLVRQISQKNVFLDYLEGKISFIPTYKYDPGTDTWDTSEKCRTPAWCDRILWRGSNVGQLCYRSHMACKLSDHKPVSSIFESGIKVIDRAKQRQVYEDVMKQLDKWENEFLPQVEVSTMEIKFKDIKFIEQKKEILVVSNTGQVPVQFEFIPKPSDTNFCEPWLSVEPSKAVISVGAKCEVHLSVYVNKDTGPSLNSGKARIEDILVLHLDGGKDLFITVSGNYIPSSFSSSIETLVRMFKPVTDVETGSLIEIPSDQASSPNPSEDPPLDIPKEIWRLVDHLYKYGMEQDELFRQPGLHSEIQLIRDCLDQGKPRLLPGSVHSVAEALLLFLEVLPEPVVPYEHYDLCLHVCDNFTQAKQVLQRLPTSHRNVFKYICAFLRELLKHSASNFLDARFLASFFGGLLLRRQASTVDDAVPARREEERKRSSFIYHFLVNAYDE